MDKETEEKDLDKQLFEVRKALESIVLTELTDDQLRSYYSLTHNIAYEADREIYHRGIGL